MLLDLANPEQALGLYLDALLRETVATPAEVPLERSLAPSQPTQSRVAVPVEAATRESVAVPVRSRDLNLQAESVVAPASAPPIPPTRPAAAPVPKEPFQTLLFGVGGLTVAVPLVELNGILRYPERLAAVPGLPPWGRGVIRYRNTNVIVVDSISLFLPEHLREASRTRSSPKYLIVLGGGRFGLACDAVDHVITLKPEEVHWRGERGRRPWLAGTIKERLCALLEVSALVRLLKTGRLEELSS